MTGQNDKWGFYQDRIGQWHWRRTAPNGAIVGASSEGYWNKQDCIANAHRNGYDLWDFYQDELKQWRWRRISQNRRIVGASTEGYWNKQDCVNNAARNGYTGL